MPDIDLTSPWPGPQLGRLLRPCTVPVPLLGAGISADAGMPLGSGLAAWLLEHPLANGLDLAGLPPALRSNPLQVSQYILDHHSGASAQQLEADVRAHLTALAEAARLTDELLAVARTPGRLILSLNYDPLVQRAAGEQGIDVVTVTRDRIPALIGGTLPRPADALHVVHLHGVLGKPEPLVLAADSYAKAMADGDIPALFAAVMATRCFCLIGTSFEEPYLKLIFNRFRQSPPRHVIVCGEDNSRRMDEGAPGALTRLDGIVACSYAAGRHDVIPGFCTELVRCDEPAGATDIAEHAPVDRHYVPRRLLRTDNEDDPQIALLLGRGEIIDDVQLAHLPRALITGGPGTGKTELLKSLAAHPADNHAPALIRMRDISEVTGSPETLLREWIIAADPAYATIDPDDALSGRVRLHLLLDALDEHPPSTRAAALDAIGRIADAFPSARIALTSRPTTSLAELDWPRYELQSDPAWREAYLAAVGSSTQEFLVRVAPARPAIDPLLSTPFFVRRLAELDDEELAVALAGADALSVVLALLHRQIDADPRLARDAASVEAWLTRVALRMQLSGHRIMALAEFEPLTAALDLGDPVLLTDRLAGRALLDYSAEGWSFDHRLFADCLVAEYLVSEDPDDWLAIVAPCAHGRSALREDWQAPVNFTCRRSAAWRNALRSRDAPAAARTLSAGADADERRLAAMTLWDRASGLQVWLDASMSRGSDDAAILAQLAAPGDLDDVLKHIDQALASPSRYDRHNALDVLLHAQPERGPQLLAEAMASETDSTLRRNAASWARRLDLAELRDAVLEHALAPDDESEAGDMASVALALTPPQQRPEIAMAMLDAGNAEVRDHMVMEGMTSMQQLRWLRDVARRRPVDAPYDVSSRMQPLLTAVTGVAEGDQRVVGELLALTQAASEEARDWVAAHPAAAEGLVTALTHEKLHAYDIAGLLRAAGSAALAVAGAEGEVVDWVRGLEEAPPVPPRMSVVTPPLELPDDIDHVLAMAPDERFATLIRQSTRRANEAREATLAQRERLNEILDETWNEQDLRNGITPTADGATVAAWANLVLTYGPATEMSLTEDRWAQAATCGWLFSKQHRWLGLQADQQRIDRAAGDAPATARVLADLLILATAHGTGIVAGRILELTAAEVTGSDGRRLLDALVRAGGADTLRALRERHPDLDNVTDARLARARDTDAQRHELRALRDRLTAGERITRDDAPWLDEIRDPELLDDVVAVVVAGHTHFTSSPDFFSAARAAVAAVEAIGGTAALDALDEIITTRPWEGAQWLTGTREALLQRELGQVAAAPAAARLAELGIG